MKGLLLSLVGLLAFAVSTIAIARFVRLPRQLKLLIWMTPIGAVAYFLLYASTPPNLHFLADRWMCSNSTLDLWYGFVVYILNCHTLIDCISGSCGGFSVSLLVIFLGAPNQTASTAEVIAKFKLGDETDSIYAWRLPHLEKHGYVLKGPATRTYSLTTEGRLVARIALGLKRLMNLGEGG